MIEEFKNLNQEEADLMYKAPLLVSVLIAGADNDFENTELQHAISLSKLKQEKAREGLIDYYREAGKDFEDKMKFMIHQYPSSAADRNASIITELEKINSILPKLDQKFSTELCASLRDMARKLAETSGGVLGYMAVGYEESKLIGLEMIKNPED